MTENEKDELADDAAYAVCDVFAVHHVSMSEEDMFDLNDYLTALLNKLTKI